MTSKDIQLYCCRGISKSCTCRQLPMKTLSFKKVPTNDNYPMKGIFLNEWPYKNHDPRKQDQLASTIVESYYGQQQQQQQRAQMPLESPYPVCSCIYSNDKFLDQWCFYQKLTLVNGKHV